MSCFFSFGKKLLCCLCSSLIVFSLVVPHSFAQSDAPDFEAPLIEHDEFDFSATDSPQVFGAQVADNVGLKSVKLFYRFDSEGDYTTVDMRPVANSSFYMAEVSTESAMESATESATIEYYIQAEDEAGNVVLKGFAFAPLVRDLPAPVQTDISLQAQEVEGVAEKPKSKVLYYVLGAIAVGALVGLAGSGGDDDDSSSPPLPDPDENCCNVTFTLDTP